MALICHCAAVRERTIVKAIHHGACTLEDLQAATGVASQCRGCEPAVLELLERHAGVEHPVHVPFGGGITVAVTGLTTAPA